MNDSTPSPSTGRVAVIALDGGTWDLAGPWMEDGTLPHLAQLVRGGVRAPMQAELPPSSVPNWPAFMTGTNAGKHGCLWWLQRDRDGTPDRQPISASSVRGGTLWQYLTQLGKRLVVLNVPVTYPVAPVNGVMVSGLLTPRSAGDFVQPNRMKTDLDELVGGYRVYPEGSFGKGRELAFLESLLDNMRQHTSAARHLLRREPWDFFMLVLGATDEGAHKYWHYSDPEHRLYDPAQAARLGDSLKRIYQTADECLGELLEEMAEDDTVIVMSDHGFGPVERFFLPNNWLMQAGHLRLKSSPRALAKRLAFRMGFTPRNIYPLGKQLLSLLPGSRSLRQRLDPARRGQSPLRRIFLSMEDVDWERTWAYATGFLYAQVYLNLEGREPQGIVPGDQYETAREALAAELAAVVDPATGRRHYERIYRREELYWGPNLEALPDLICVPAEGRTVDSGIDFRSNRLFEFDTSLTGTHRPLGMFVMRGPGVRRGADIDPVRIFDIAPMVLYQLGLAIPEDMDGHVMASAWEPGQLERRPPLSADRDPKGPTVEDVYSTEEESAITSRLRDLGYLS